MIGYKIMPSFQNKCHQTLQRGRLFAGGGFVFILVCPPGGVRGGGHVQRAQALITTGESGNVLALGCWLPGHNFLPSVSAQRARSCTNVLVTDLGRRESRVGGSAASATGWSAPTLPPSSSWLSPSPGSRTGTSLRTSSVLRTMESSLILSSAICFTSVERVLPQLSTAPRACSLTLPG